MASAYVVEEARTLDDIQQALAVWENNLALRSSAEEKYRWFYDIAPFRKGRIWLLKWLRSGKAVGVQGLGFRRFSNGRDTIIGGLLSDLAIDKDHRILGPALQLQKHVMNEMQDSIDFLYAFPNKGASDVLKRVGYVALGSFTRCVKILKTRNYIDQVIKNRPISAAASFFLDFAVKMEIWSKFIMAGRGYSVAIARDAEGSIKASYAQKGDTTLFFGDRSDKYLEWRYKLCPDFAYDWFTLKDYNGNICGYIIYFVQDRQVQVVDMLWSGIDKARVLKEAFMHFERHCLKSDVESICIAAFAPRVFLQYFASIGYVYRESSRMLFLKAANDKNSYHSLFEPENSMWLLGDEDNN